MHRPTIEQLRQHPWVIVDYTVAMPRDPVPKDGTNDDLFEPTVNPETLSNVRPCAPARCVTYFAQHVHSHLLYLIGLLT